MSYLSEAEVEGVKQANASIWVIISDLETPKDQRLLDVLNAAYIDLHRALILRAVVERTYINIAIEALEALLADCPVLSGKLHQVVVMLSSVLRGDDDSSKGA